MPVSQCQTFRVYYRAQFDSQQASVRRSCSPGGGGALQQSIREVKGEGSAVPIPPCAPLLASFLCGWYKLLPQKFSAWLTASPPISFIIGCNALMRICASLPVWHRGLQNIDNVQSSTQIKISETLADYIFLFTASAYNSDNASRTKCTIVVSATSLMATAPLCLPYHNENP